MTCTGFMLVSYVGSARRSSRWLTGRSRAEHDERGELVVPRGLIGRREVRVGGARVRDDEDPGAADRFLLRPELRDEIGPPQGQTCEGTVASESMKAHDARPVPAQAR